MNITLPANILLAGATMSGKSHFTNKTLLPALKGQFDVLIICSPTLDVNGDYDHITDDQKTVFKISENIPEAISELIHSQQKLFKSMNQKMITKDQIPRILVILDDCLGNKIFDDRGILSKFAIKSRHYRMSFICMTQRIAGISRQYRVNSAYVFLFSVMNFTEIERFILEMVPKKFQKGFQEKLIDIYSTKYNFVFVNSREQSIKKRIFKNGTDLIEFT